jgi:hypothetical protein
MSKGMEMMISSVIKMLGLDPVMMVNAIEDIRKSLHNAAADMATIRRQNSAIMAHLGIAEPITGELTNGHARDFGSGQGQGRSPANG